MEHNEFTILSPWSSFQEETPRTIFPEALPSPPSERYKSPPKTPIGLNGTLQPTTPVPQVLRRLLRMIIKLRDEQFRGRLRLKEKRNELQEARLEGSEADAQFMNLVRSSLEQGRLPDLNALEMSYQKLQDSRNEIGLLQYEYDEVEDEYDTAEMKLDEQEQLFSHSPIFMAVDGRLDEDSNLSDSSSGPVIVSKLPNGYPNVQDQNALTEYESRVGDANIVWERLQEELYAYSQQQRYKTAQAVSGNEYPLAAQEALNDLESSCAQLRDELASIEFDVKQLGNKAVEAGFSVSWPFWMQQPLPSVKHDLILDEDDKKFNAVVNQSDVEIETVRETSRGIEDAVHNWMEQSHQSSSFESAYYEDNLHSMRTEAINEENWNRSRRRLRRQETLAQKAPWDSWVILDPGIRSENDGLTKYAQLDQSALSQASRAMHEFEWRFDQPQRTAIRREEYEFPQMRHRAAPYSEAPRKRTTRSLEHRPAHMIEATVPYDSGFDKLTLGSEAGQLPHVHDGSTSYRAYSAPSGSAFMELDIFSEWESRSI